MPDQSSSTTPPNNSPDTSAQSSRRRAREQAVELPAASTAAPPAPPVALEAMLGQGSKVRMASAEYEMSALPLGKMREAQEILARWPDVLIFAGFTEPADDGADIDAEKVAAMLTAVNLGAGEDSPVPASDVFRTIAYLTSTIDQDQIDAIVELFALALRRNHPDITQAVIADEIDIPSAVKWLRVFFAVNSGLKGRFLKP